MENWTTLGRMIFAGVAPEFNIFDKELQVLERDNLKSDIMNKIINEDNGIKSACYLMTDSGSMGLSVGCADNTSSG